MAMMPELRNQLVDFSPSGRVPEAEEVGVVLTCRPGAGSARVQVGVPVFVVGAYLADGELLRACPNGVGMGLEVLMERLDTPAGWVDALIADVAPMDPLDDEPNYGPNYRERGAFEFDPSFSPRRQRRCLRRHPIRGPVDGQ